MRVIVRGGVGAVSVSGLEAVGGEGIKTRTYHYKHYVINPAIEVRHVLGDVHQLRPAFQADDLQNT